MNLSVSNIGYRYSRHFALSDVSLDFTEPVTALIGPNGAGKSTLIKCLAHVYPCAGSMQYEGRAVDFTDREFFKRHVGYLPQTSRNDATITVFEAILLGLMNNLSLTVSKNQIEAVERMLELFDLTALVTRSLKELSGGQVQMVLLAQALIKEPEILLLDEPLNNLDVHRQFALMNMISGISFGKKMLTVIVLHDIHLAARYADRIAVMHQGRLYDYGTPTEVLTTEMMRTVYKLETVVHKGAGGCPMLEYIDIARDEIGIQPVQGEAAYETVAG